MNNTVHNEIAKKSYDIVKEISNNDVKKEFRSLSRSFPSMIQVNGLCCAIAFLYSKIKQNDDGKEKNKDEKGNEKKEKQSKNAHELLYSAIENWLKDVSMLKDDNLMETIACLKNKEYYLYTNEVMDLCLWLKRFAEGMLSE